MKILLSIKPRFAAKILDGEKRVEFRRVVPRRALDRVVMYVSAPVGRIVGEFAVGEVLTASLDELWRRTRTHAGVSKLEFGRYFAGRTRGHALTIESIQQYDEACDPRTVIEEFRPPQSFVYLDDDESALDRALAAYREPGHHGTPQT